MMKMTILAPRRPGMTHEAFRQYVVETHGPLVKSVTEVVADIRHYHYNFPVVGAGDPVFGLPLAELDILTQGFFDSREAQLQNMQHPQFKTILRPDESNFADTERALMHYTDEHVVQAGEKTSSKLFYLRRRAAGMAREVFQKRWRDEAGPLMWSALQGAGATRYVQNHVQAEQHHPDGESPRYFDVIDEFWLAGSPSPDKHKASAQMAALAGLESALLEQNRSRAFVATMVPNIP